MPLAANGKNYHMAIKFGVINPPTLQRPPMAADGAPRAPDRWCLTMTSVYIPPATAPSPLVLSSISATQPRVMRHTLDGAIVETSAPAQGRPSTSALSYRAPALPRTAPEPRRTVAEPRRTVAEPRRGSKSTPAPMPAVPSPKVCPTGHSMDAEHVEIRLLFSGRSTPGGGPIQVLLGPGLPTPPPPGYLTHPGLNFYPLPYKKLSRNFRGAAGSGPTHPPRHPLPPGR